MVVSETANLIHLNFSGHCKQLAPEYTKAAQKLAAHEPPYYLAKVDGTVNTALASRFAVESYPTLIFFRRGNQIKFSGGRTESEIVQWYISKTKPISTLVDSCENL